MSSSGQRSASRREGVAAHDLWVLRDDRGQPVHGVAVLDHDPRALRPTARGLTEQLEPAPEVCGAPGPDQRTRQPHLGHGAADAVPDPVHLRGPSINEGAVLLGCFAEKARIEVPAGDLHLRREHALGLDRAGSGRRQRLESRDRALDLVCVRHAEHLGQELLFGRGAVVLLRQRFEQLTARGLRDVGVPDAGPQRLDLQLQDAVQTGAVLLGARQRSGRSVDPAELELRVGEPAPDGRQELR